MKHYDLSPYSYALVNPLKYIDPDGKDPREKVVEFIIKQILKGILKKGTQPKGVGFGNGDEDLDGDGVNDDKDEVDDRTEDDKEKFEKFKEKVDEIEIEMEREKQIMWDKQQIEKNNEQKKREQNKKPIEPYQGKGKSGMREDPDR